MAKPDGGPAAAKYAGEFKSRRDVASEFEQGSGYRRSDEFVIAADFPSDEQIVFATYDVDGYEGSAFVLFERDGKLFEVSGSHCSCMGLEGQWTPEETSWAALAMREPSSYGAPQQVVDEAKRRLAQREQE